jgi:hypothetical protein
VLATELIRQYHRGEDPYEVSCIATFYTPPRRSPDVPVSRGRPVRG